MLRNMGMFWFFSNKVCIVMELESGCPHPAISPKKSGVKAPRLHNLHGLRNYFDATLVIVYEVPDRLALADMMKLAASSVAQ